MMNTHYSRYLTSLSQRLETVKDSLAHTDWMIQPEVQYPIGPDNLYVEWHLGNEGGSSLDFPVASYQLHLDYYNAHGDLLSTVSSHTIQEFTRPSGEVTTGSDYQYRMVISDLHGNQPTGAESWRYRFQIVDNNEGTTEVGTLFTILLRTVGKAW